MTIRRPGPAPRVVRAPVHDDRSHRRCSRRRARCSPPRASAALTVRRIATEAGVSTMNVYSRFGGKDGDRRAPVDRGLLPPARRAWTPCRRPTIRSTTSRRCGAGYRRFALDNPTYYSVMFDRRGPATSTRPRRRSAHAGDTLQLLADRLATSDGRRARCPTADPMHTAAAVWAACHGVVSLEMKDVGPPSLDWAEVYATTTDCADRSASIACGAPPAGTPP